MSDHEETVKQIMQTEPTGKMSWKLPGLGERTTPSPADILHNMAETYRERNAVYGDNWRNVGGVMLQLFPGGIHLTTADECNRWHLFEIIVVKLTRFANSGLSHADSIHDIAVYAAMLESIIHEKENGK